MVMFFWFALAVITLAISAIWAIYSMRDVAAQEEAIFENTKPQQLPIVDQAIAGLLSEHKQRALDKPLAAVAANPAAKDETKALAIIEKAKIIPQPPVNPETTLSPQYIHPVTPTVQELGTYLGTIYSGGISHVVSV